MLKRVRFKRQLIYSRVEAHFSGVCIKKMQNVEIMGNFEVLSLRIVGFVAKLLRCFESGALRQVVSHLPANSSGF
jgi:hypothetical protein